MEGLGEREVLRVDRLWRDEGAKPWLISFYLAEVDGRLECAGMTVRSFLMLEDGEGPDPHLRWVQSPVDPFRAERKALERTAEKEAIRVGAGTKRSGMTSPLPLRATTLRQLPFGSLLASATKERAERDRSIHAKWWNGVIKPHLLQTYATNERREGILHDFEAVLDRRVKLSDAVESASRQRHQPERTERPSLDRVARLYEAAYRSGSHSPTRDVAEALGRSRSTVAKWIMRCREAGLLAPTSRGQAGGIGGGAHGEES